MIIITNFICNLVLILCYYKVKLDHLNLRGHNWSTCLTGKPTEAHSAVASKLILTTMRSI